MRSFLVYSFVQFYGIAFFYFYENSRFLGTACILELLTGVEPATLSLRIS